MFKDFKEFLKTKTMVVELLKADIYNLYICTELENALDNEDVKKDDLGEEFQEMANIIKDVISKDDTLDAYSVARYVVSEFKNEGIEELRNQQISFIADSVLSLKN